MKSSNVTPAQEPVTLRAVNGHVQPGDNTNLHCRDFRRDTKHALLRRFDLYDKEG